MTDAPAQTAELIKCPTVTPVEGGAIELLETLLGEAGFRTARADRGGIANLFARWGSTGPVLGFNGHTDVVPTGDVSDWTHDPFAAVIEDGTLYGRGAADMKSGVAAFVAAAVDFVASTPPEGSIIITITGDEEGDSVDGTQALLDWMDAKRERMDHCIVGEPTCPKVMGEMIKIGRRGSMNVVLEARGVQGHSAYPHLAKNPLHALVRLLDRLASHKLDDGTEHFDASTLAITSVDTSNTASNVIPAQATAALNIRFNDAYDSAALSNWIDAEAARVAGETGVEITARAHVSGESFLTAPGPITDLVSASIQAETGVIPVQSTSGGTSDARFIKDRCPVVEAGLVGATMHQVDERVEVADIHKLKVIYTRIMADYFASPDIAG
jgi:succinyl-diaminopimelate desuccinylase